MSLLSIIEIYARKYPYMHKERLAEIVADTFMAENPSVRSLNTSTLRHFIFNVLSYNKMPGDDPDCSPYSICKASSMTIPFKDSKLTITKSKDGLILKACPVCKMTAQVGDPVCPNCNHFYSNHEDEEDVIMSAACMLTASANPKKVNLHAAEVVVDDEVEGFRITEGDIDKIMPTVKKYIPTN